MSPHHRMKTERVFAPKNNFPFYPIKSNFMDTLLDNATQEDNLPFQTRSELSYPGYTSIRKSVGWMRFAGILFCLLGGIMVLAAIRVFYIFSNIGLVDLGSLEFFGFSVFRGFYFWVLALGSILMGTLLLISARAFSDYRTSHSGNALDLALYRLRLFWMGLGITIVVFIMIFLFSEISSVASYGISF